jgi:hypothetical protein
MVLIVRVERPEMHFFRSFPKTAAVMSAVLMAGMLLTLVFLTSSAQASSYEPYWRQLSGELLAMKQWHDQLAAGIPNRYSSPTYETLQRDVLRSQAEVLDVQVTLSRVHQLRLTVDRLWALMPPPTSVYGGPERSLQTQRLLIDLATVTQSMEQISQQMQASQFQPPYIANGVPDNWPVERAKLVKTLAQFKPYWHLMGY